MSTNTDGGTLASLGNTPQAKDDYYTMSEDQWRVLDVLANDLGGNAKTLWSIDTTSDDGVADLVAKDVVGCVDNSELGAAISLTSDGKILYDTRSSAAISSTRASGNQRWSARASLRTVTCSIRCATSARRRCSPKV